MLLMQISPPSSSVCEELLRPVPAKYIELPVNIYILFCRQRHFVNKSRFVRLFCEGGDVNAIQHERGDE